MSITDSKKLFLDRKEDITFIVEKVVNADEERVILVVPQNSILFSSVISLGILHMQAVKAKKNVIIVTEDDQGSKLAQKSGFVVVQKVSQINAQLWDLVYDRMLKSNTSLHNKSKEIQESKEESKESVIEKDGSGVKEEVNLDGIANYKNEDNVEKEQAPEVKSKDNEGDSYTNKSVSGQHIEEEVQEIPSHFAKQRKEAKMVKLDGIEIYAGGNLKKKKNSGEDSDKIGTVKNTNMNDGEKAGRTNFAGRDFTNTVNPATKKKGLFSFLKREKKPQDPDDRLQKPKKSRFTRKQVMLFVLFFIVVLGLLASYFLVYRFNSVDISLEVQKQDVAAEDRIIGDSELEEVDFESNTIPARKLEVENLSTSRTGEASGVGRRGEKASGFVTVFNLLPEGITLEEGTKFTSLLKQKTYVLRESVTIDAAEIDELEVPEAKFSTEVAIEAIDFGEEYNIPDSAETTKFGIEGYDKEDVYATRFEAIDGGALEEYTVVSESDVDQLKEKFFPELEEQGIEKIQNFVPSGYVLIEESIDAEEVNIQPSPAVAEEVEDGAFNLSMEINVTAYAVKEDDLIDISAEILNEDGTNRTVSSINNIKISNVDMTENSVAFDVSFEGTVGSTFTEENVEDAIKGKSIKEVKKYFSEQQDIENYRVTFSPEFLPTFMQLVPNDPGRISVDVK